ncbi:hypothetical protein TNCV_2739611 [Trichonephila clavipes]|nr:hypothetical protein TNCV_2739611 [Trichonephila clavipes]
MPRFKRPPVDVEGKLGGRMTVQVSSCSLDHVSKLRAQPVTDTHLLNRSIHFSIPSIKKNSGRLRIHLPTAARTLESCIHHYNTENKRQSMEYRHSVTPKVKKFKTLMSATKVMLTTFWDARGVLYTEFLTNGLTVNSDRGTVQHNDH